MQYGARAKGLALKNNISLATATRFIANYYNRYPEVDVWQKGVMEKVKKSRTIIPDRHTDKGFPQAAGMYKSITGRIYTFREYDNPYYSGEKAGASKRHL